MKIGFYCESPADQAALRVFVEGLLGESPEPISMDLEAHSVPGFFSALGGVFRGVHFNSDAEGLVIVVDSDDTTMHDIAHDSPGPRDDRCRMCLVHKILEAARRNLRPRVVGPPLKVAIGLTVPAIEAWYLVGKNHEVGEAAWRVRLTTGRVPFTRPQLKQFVYGTDRPSLEVEAECGVREARRIIANIGAIEAAFPVGFGLMAQEIRGWIAEVGKGGATQ